MFMVFLRAARALGVDEGSWISRRTPRRAGGLPFR
jgi:hypothetical protein